jgi:hypothetical protein
MTRDLAQECIGIANQEMCDLCKISIKDELTRRLDMYNDAKLKRMYKLTDQDIYKRANQDIYKRTNQDIYKRIQAQDDRMAGWLDLGRCRS